MPQIELKGRVSLDGSGFDRTLTRLRSGATAFTRSVSGMLAGFFSAAYLANQARKTAEYAGKIHDLAEAHKTSAERLQEYDHAAKESGTTLDKLLDVQRRLAQARADALANPGGAASSAFAEFGFTQDRLASLTRADDLMRDFSAAIKGVNLDLNAMPTVLALIGERNSDAIPALLAGLKEAGDDAHRLGLIMEAGIAQQLDEIADKAAVLERQLTIGLGPVLIRIANLFSEIVGGARIGASFIGALFSKMGTFGLDDQVKTIITESFKAAKDAATATTMQVMEEQATIEEARRRKRNGRTLSLDDLLDAKGSKVRAAVTGQRATAEVPLNLNELQRIGGFAGDRDNFARDLGRQILREAKTIATNTRSTGSVDLF